VLIIKVKNSRLLSKHDNSFCLKLNLKQKECYHGCSTSLFFKSSHEFVYTHTLVSVTVSTFFSFCLQCITFSSAFFSCTPLFLCPRFALDYFKNNRTTTFFEVLSTHSVHYIIHHHDSTLLQRWHLLKNSPLFVL
jgi:hypothetical protein